MAFIMINFENKILEIVSVLQQKEKLCEKCNSKTKLKHRKQGFFFICNEKFCKSEASIFKNTVFYRNRINQEIILQVLYFWINQFKTKQIMTILNISRNKIWSILKKAKKIIIDRYYENFGKIGGENIIVEIDESKFGKRKYNRGHHVDGVWVFGCVERTPERKIFLQAVPNRSAHVLLEILNQRVEIGSIIHSDCFRSYNSVENYFRHFTVNHSINFVSPIGVHTNTIEGCWSAIKSTISNRNRTRRDISLYLVRFMLVRNYKEQAFDELINLLL